MKRALASATLAALALFAIALPQSARAQVVASLVTADASIHPGTPFTVALRLVHQPHWHTYWVNPGTGLPTKLKWTLPLGWTSGEIQWPAPMLLSDSRANIIGNGYDGDLLLPVTITPPADLVAGKDVVLQVAAEWLMCQDECVPGNARLSLQLPVSSDDPQPDPVWGAKIRAVIAQLPAADPAWAVTASRGANTVTRGQADRRGRQPRPDAGGPSLLLTGRHHRLRPSAAGGGRKGRRVHPQASDRPGRPGGCGEPGRRPHLEGGLALGRIPPGPGGRRALRIGTGRRRDAGGRTRRRGRGRAPRHARPGVRRGAHPQPDAVRLPGPLPQGALARPVPR
jgi:DsbC/DsbD-like thiol-disulfide interchange protein